MFKWQKLNIITNIIPNLCTLISNVKDSIVCSGVWDYRTTNSAVIEQIGGVIQSKGKRMRVLQHF